VSRAGGSARPRVAATVSSSPASDSTDAAGVPVPDLAVPAAQAPADAPPAPQQPSQDPTPATAVGSAGCGGPGADQGVPKGTSAPTAVGVLGSPFEVSLAVNDAAPTAPAAGSTATSADDPGSRPD
jgi:hypothetical protein